MVDEAPPSPAPLSKKQQRKQDKAKWLAARKAQQAADGVSPSKRKRRNQRQSRLAAADASARPSPTVHYGKCTLSTCANQATAGCVIRSIEPYVHRFALFAKGRWSGRSLRELFAAEFPTLSTEYCRQAVQLGLVRLNGQPADLDTVVNAGDFLEHVKHRHEPSVHLPAVGQSDLTNLSTEWICFEAAEVVVVDKPSGLPVHPTGSYQFNALTTILKADRKLELFPVHRLDRLTSGLLILAKSADKARSLTAELTATSTDGSCDRSVQKFYVARVQGEFPTDEEGLADVQGLSSGLVKIESAHDGFWRVTAPIGMVSPRQGHLRGVTDSPDSKACITLVRRRGEAVGGESIVECLLVTGRTHQIRVHLQHLGFPIVNDPMYGPKKIRKTMTRETESKVEERPADSIPADGSEEEVDEDEEKRCIRVCEACTAAKENRPVDCEEDTVLWLHSYRYQSPSWSFAVPLPSWANLSGQPTGDEKQQVAHAVDSMTEHAIVEGSEL